jgi:hypothetical protein
MRRPRAIAAAGLVATLAVAVPAFGIAEPPSEEEYVVAVDPICKEDREAGERILRGAQDNINKKRFNIAGNQLIRASKRFGTTIRQIVAVPRPVAKEEKLQKWFGFLRLVKTRMAKAGKLYKEGKELQATHESIRAERSGNAANNVSFSFGFRYCRLSRSRFN